MVYIGDFCDVMKNGAAFSAAAAMSRQLRDLKFYNRKFTLLG